MARSISPTIFSDYGSEWTFPVNFDDDRATTALSTDQTASATDIAHAQFLQLVHDKMFGPSLTSRSFVVRPNTPIDHVFESSRPRTALPHFKDEKEVNQNLLHLKQTGGMPFGCNLTENNISASCMMFPHKSVDVSAFCTLYAHTVHVKCVLKTY